MEIRSQRRAEKPFNVASKPLTNEALIELATVVPAAKIAAIINVEFHHAPYVAEKHTVTQNHPNRNSPMLVRRARSRFMDNSRFLACLGVGFVFRVDGSVGGVLPVCEYQQERCATERSRDDRNEASGASRGRTHNPVIGSECLAIRLLTKRPALASLALGHDEEANEDECTAD